MKKYGLVFVMILISIIVSGCYDYSDITERAMILGVAIDKDDDEYQITIQILYIEPAKEGAVGQIKPIAYTAKDKSIYSAFSKISLMSPRYLCYTHIQLVVVSEEIAKEGILSVMDFLMRHYESRQEFYILIAKDVTAKDTLETYTILEGFPVFNIRGSVEIAVVDHGMSNAITYDEFLSLIIKEGIEPAVSGLTIEGDIEKGRKEENTEFINPEAYLKVKSMAIFKYDKLIGWFDDDESRGYNFALGHINETVHEFPCDEENYIDIRITKNNPGITTEIKDNKVISTIEIDVLGRIAQLGCPFNIEEGETLMKIEKMFNESLEELVKKTIEATQQKFNSDALGIGRKVYQQNLKYWQENKDSWDEIFPTIEINVKVKSHLTRRGQAEHHIYKR
jgi:spore germination protein KC